MRIRAACSDATNRLPWIVVVFSLALTVVVGTPSKGRSVEPSNAWEKGQYRDFRPARTQALRAPSGFSTRSLEPVLKLERTAVQRPRLNPGDATSLLAQYDVAVPSGTVDVKETRIIEFNGAVLAKLVKTTPRSSGPVGSEYQLTIPRDAAEGWYAVRTVIEPARATTRSITTEQANAAFYVEPTRTSEPASAIEPPRKEGERPRAGADEGMKIKLWADKRQYKVGDTVSLHFETNRDAYLTLVNVGTSGKITILFPNRFSDGNGVNGKQAYVIPAPDDNYDLALSGPAGTELIYALVTSKPVRFFETDFSKTSEIFPTVTENAGVLTRDINVVVKKTPLKEQAKAVLELEVVP